MYKFYCIIYKFYVKVSVVCYNIPSSTASLEFVAVLGLAVFIQSTCNNKECWITINLISQNICISSSSLLTSSSVSSYPIVKYSVANSCIALSLIWRVRILHWLKHAILKQQCFFLPLGVPARYQQIIWFFHLRFYLWKRLLQGELSTIMAYLLLCVEGCTCA